MGTILHNNTNDSEKAAPINVECVLDFFFLFSAPITYTALLLRISYWTAILTRATKKRNECNRLLYGLCGVICYEARHQTAP